MSSCLKTQLDCCVCSIKLIAPSVLALTDAFTYEYKSNATAAAAPAYGHHLVRLRCVLLHLCARRLLPCRRDAPHAPVGGSLEDLQRPG